MSQFQNILKDDAPPFDFESILRISPESIEVKTPMKRSAPVVNSPELDSSYIDRVIPDESPSLSSPRVVSQSLELDSNIKNVEIDDLPSSNIKNVVELDDLPPLVVSQSDESLSCSSYVSVRSALSSSSSHYVERLWVDITKPNLPVNNESFVLASFM